MWLQLWSSGAVPSGLSELDIVLQRSEDAQELSHLLPDLEHLVDMKLEGLSDKGKGWLSLITLPGYALLMLMCCLCPPTEKQDMFALEACANVAESLERILVGFVDFVMVSWVMCRSSFQHLQC